MSGMSLQARAGDTPLLVSTIIVSRWHIILLFSRNVAYIAMTCDMTNGTLNNE